MTRIQRRRAAASLAVCARWRFESRLRRLHPDRSPAAILRAEANRVVSTVERGDRPHLRPVAVVVPDLDDQAVTTAWKRFLFDIAHAASVAESP